MKEITLKSILDQIERMAKSDKPLDPAVWVNGAMRITALLGTEHSKLIQYKVEYNKVKLNLIKKYDNKVSLAVAEADTTEEYVKMEEQEMFIKRIEELCRLCKKRSELASNEYKLN